MKVRLYICFICLSLFFIACKSKIKQEEIHQLSNEEWVLTSDTLKGELKALVPGNLRLDLMRAQTIQDPFWADEAEKELWISAYNWTYSCLFECSEEELTYNKILLHFEGLDTYADVFLNDSLLFSSNNMFRSWKMDCKQYLQTQNQLKIIFYPSKEKNRKAAQNAPFPLPEQRVYTRKAAYQYGWDWGPTIPGIGIWKPISLHFYDRVAWQELNTQTVLDSLCKQGQLNVSLGIDSDRQHDLHLDVYENGVLFAEREWIAEKGFHDYHLCLERDKPTLWFPHDLGEPYLYQYEFVLKCDDQEIKRVEKKLGYKKIYLVQEKDSTGASFGFQINNRAFFAKGANYIPMDNLLSRIHAADYRQLLTDVKKSNMNMLRVWGGGVYEKESFYDLCDSLGILIWQDFMFACNFYPADSAFKSNVKKEIIQEVSRIGAHPSLALWCGNNEIDEAYHNWGWQKSLNYSPEDSIQAWRDYQSIFDTLIPDQLQNAASDIPYWPSSPSIGWGHQESLQEGDSHYWGVWWGEEPFENYQKKVGRMMSEFGFQGYPELKTVNRFGDSSQIYLNSPSLLAHQKHPRGEELIRTYMARDFYVPDNLADFIYSSQILQLYGVSQAVESHRRAMPYCQGSLYWQLNDCWPVVSWSSIDYFGCWKPLQYQIKRIFEPLYLSLKQEGNTLSLFAISDSDKDKQLDYRLIVKDFKGEQIRGYGGKADVKALQGTTLAQIPIGTDLGTDDLKNTYVQTQLLQKGQVISSNLHLLCKPRDLQIDLNPDLLQFEFHPHPQGVLIKLTAKTFIPYIVLSTTHYKGFFTDNAFHMEAGQSKELIWESDFSVEDLKKNLIVKSLLDNLKYRSEE